MEELEEEVGTSGGAAAVTCTPMLTPFGALRPFTTENGLPNDVIVYPLT